MQTKKKISEIAVSYAGADPEKVYDYIRRCAATAMNSKLIAHQKAFFSKIIVDAIMLLDNDIDTDMIGIAKEVGGGLEDSFLVEGVAFKKTFSYAGFEMQVFYPFFLSSNRRKF